MTLTPPSVNVRQRCATPLPLPPNLFRLFPCTGYSLQRRRSLRGSCSTTDTARLQSCCGARLTAATPGRGRSNCCRLRCERAHGAVAAHCQQATIALRNSPGPNTRATMHPHSAVGSQPCNALHCEFLVLHRRGAAELHSPWVHHAEVQRLRRHVHAPGDHSYAGSPVQLRRHVPCVAEHAVGAPRDMRICVRQRPRVRLRHCGRRPLCPLRPCRRQRQSQRRSSVMKSLVYTFNLPARKLRIAQQMCRGKIVREATSCDRVGASGSEYLDVTRWKMTTDGERARMSGAEVWPHRRRYISRLSSHHAKPC